MVLLRNLINLNAINILKNANILLNENRRYRQCDDPFELSDTKFIKLFRLNKEMVERLIYIVEEYSDQVARRSQFDAEQKVIRSYYYFRREMFRGIQKFYQYFFSPS